MSEQKEFKFEYDFIGEQLKMLRISQDKKISEVAEASGFTESYISQIENGRRSLNYKTLRKILVYGFGESLASFFSKAIDGGGDESMKLFRTPPKLFSENRDVCVEILIPADLSNEIEVVRISIARGSAFEENFQTEFKLYGTILSGEVILWLRNGIKLSKGGSFALTVRSSETHDFKISNVCDDEARVLLIFSPPVF